APFGAEGQALDDAHEDQKRWSQHADLLVGGQHADEECGKTHDDQRSDKHRLAPDLVTEMAADDPAQGTGSETYAQGGEGCKRSRERVSAGEECMSEIQGGRGAEADEIVGFNGGSDAG